MLSIIEGDIIMGSISKKSLTEAENRARQHSVEHPSITVRVMDKYRKHAVVCASEWVYNERILDGWHTVVTYRNGKVV